VKATIDIDYDNKNFSHSIDWGGLQITGIPEAIILLDEVWKETRAALIAQLSARDQEAIGVAVIVSADKAKELLQS